MSAGKKRWDIVAPGLQEAKDKGLLGVVAASTGIAEYRLHDLTKLSGAPGRQTLTSHEVQKLYEYFKARQP